MDEEQGLETLKTDAPQTGPVAPHQCSVPAFFSSSVIPPSSGLFSTSYMYLLPPDVQSISQSPLTSLMLLFLLKTILKLLCSSPALNSTKTYKGRYQLIFQNCVKNLVTQWSKWFLALDVNGLIFWIHTRQHSLVSPVFQGCLPVPHPFVVSSTFPVLGCLSNVTQVARSSLKHNPHTTYNFNHLSPLLKTHNPGQLISIQLLSQSGKDCVSPKTLNTSANLSRDGMNCLLLSETQNEGHCVHLHF